MGYLLFRASIGLACCFVIAAQNRTAPPTASGIIAGIVLDAAGNSPIRRAIVTLSTVETEPQDAVAWTDANGRFSFGYLPAGRYQLRVTKDGYQPAANAAGNSRRPPAVIQLAAGESRSDLVYRLQIISSISGVVLDEDGEPLSGIPVSILRPEFQRGKRRFLPGPVATTDSNGHYRVSGLVGGQYVVAMNARMGYGRPALKVHPEVSAGETQQQYSYGVQFYPAADRAESATLISVLPGQEISQVNFRLQSLPVVSIEGKVIVPPGAASVTEASINIMSLGFRNGFVGGAGFGPPDYHFVNSQLAPGSYLAVAQATVDGKRYRGTQTLEVGPQGVHDIAIPLEASIELTGTVLMQGPDAAKQPAIFVGLVPGDDIPWNGQQLRSNVNKDGSFKISGVPAGIWDINVTIPPSGYIKSMQLGDEDVLTEDMIIRPSTHEALKIVLSTRAAKLEGDVLEGDQPARAVVVLAPDGKFRNVMGFYRTAATDDKGHFEIPRARPGEYKLFAFEELDQNSIQDPDFLKPFEASGLAVTLKEGPNDSHKLSLIPAAPPAPPATGVRQ